MPAMIGAQPLRPPVVRPPEPPSNFQMPMPNVPAPPQMNVSAPPPVSVPNVSAPPINGGGGAPAPGGAGGAVPGTFSAQTDPRLTEYLTRVKARLDAPTDTTGEVNQLGQQVAAFANGQRNMAGAGAARRGVLGIGGGEDQVNTDISNVAAGNFAKGAADINLARMRDKDQMLMSAQGAFAEPGRQGLADRGIGVQAAGQAGQQALGQAELSLRAQLGNQNAAMQAQQMGNQISQQNWQAQLAAQQMAMQQQQSMAQIYANLYR